MLPLHSLVRHRILFSIDMILNFNNCFELGCALISAHACNSLLTDRTALKCVVRFIEGIVGVSSGWF